MENLTLKAAARTEFGSAAARRLRRGGGVPVLLSGAGEAPLPLTIAEHDFFMAQQAGAQLLTLEVGQEQLEALVREIQWDALGDRLLHIDFDRVTRGQLLEIEIPVEFFGEAAGVTAGGVFQKLHDRILVECQPSDIPEMVEIDVRKLKIGDDVRVKDLVFPEGVTPQLDAETVVAMISAPDVEEEKDEEEVGGIEPEVIGEASDDEENED